MQLEKSICNKFLFAVFRWLLISLFPQNLAIVILATLFHAITYGMYHAVLISLIHEYFTGILQGRVKHCIRALVLD